MFASRRRAAQQALLVVAACLTSITTIAATVRAQEVWNTSGRMQISDGIDADMRVFYANGQFRVAGQGGRYAAPQCVVPFDRQVASGYVFTLTERCSPYNVSATFTVSNWQQSGGTVGFTLSVAGTAIGDNFLWKDYSLSYSWSVSGKDPAYTPPPSGTAIERDCFNRIQGQISWDARGTTSWVDSNVENLCRGTEVATAPGYCFTTARHGQIDRGDGTAWDWPDAMRLCAGTSNEAATLQCFKDAVGQGMAVVPAIERCRKQ